MRIPSAAWRSPVTKISRGRFAARCVICKMTLAKSSPSFKSPHSNTPRDCEPTYGRINNSGNGGRPKGSRAQLGEAFIADLYADWLAHGVATIEKVRAARPADYLKVIASILPKDSNVKVSAIETMTDDELDATIARLVAEQGDDAEGEGPPPTGH